MHTKAPFPGEWSRTAPTVEDHDFHAGERLVWLVRGHPFNFPIVAETNVGVKRAPSWVALEQRHEKFVRVELMADGFHGRDSSAFGWFRHLEWLGPLAIPKA